MKSERNPSRSCGGNRAAVRNISSTATASDRAPLLAPLKVWKAAKVTNARRTANAVLTIMIIGVPRVGSARRGPTASDRHQEQRKGGGGDDPQYGERQTHATTLLLASMSTIVAHRPPRCAPGCGRSLNKRKARERPAG